MKEIFERVVDAKSTINLLDLIREHGWEKDIEAFEEKYPKELNLKFKKSEIESIIGENGPITEDHLVNINSSSPFTVLERLLLAVIWKNGQLSRIQSVVDGMTGEVRSKSNFGAIFEQFGKSMVSDDEPIVDQHVLRAFCHANDSKAKSRKTPFTKSKSDRKIIDDYVVWFKEILSSVNSEEKQEFAYLLDKILFIAGKSIE